jgi:predicted RNA-binding protein with PUA-like domain
MKKTWLMKSEPSTFSIDALAKAPKQRTRWDGVRNFQVRNMLRDEMKPGDLALFWHSSCDVPGAYGIVKIVKAGYPDPTAFDRKSDYYDADSDPSEPRWYAVDVELVRRFEKPITLEKLKANADDLGDMLVLRRGNRLSITPVTAEQWRRVLALE